jgi:hypothetical protein
MPPNIAPANPVDVLPKIVANAFTVELRLESLVNTYPDGSSERATLAPTERTYFRLTEPLSAAQWTALWDFFKAHRGVPFFVYNPRETVPPYSYDPTGQDPIGRYAVVFDGGWSETNAIGRGQVGIALREVA